MERRHTKILMVAEKFPPHATSGTARSFYFARHLGEFGYQPVVLAAPVLGGNPSDAELLQRLPPEVEVWRPSPAMIVAGSAARSAWATVRPNRQRPDAAAPRASSLRKTMTWFLYWHLDWLPPAFVRGLQVARRRDVQLVWVTAPHAKNLPLGYALSRALHRPLVVDLRDPWTYGSLWRPTSPLAERIELAWAGKILAAAALVVFTSPLTQREMEARFACLRGKCMTITNGFSDEEQSIAPRRGGLDGKCLLRHCGVLNDRRRPDPLLRGLELAVEQRPALRSSIHLEFVGDMGGNDSTLCRSGVADCVSALGRVSRSSSLALMRGADVNVLLQTITSGVDVIGGKTFDYLAARRPILAVVDPTGGDAWLLGQSTGNVVVPWNSEQDIAHAIVGLHEQWRAGTLAATSPDLAAYEQRRLTERLAGAFDRVLH